MATTSKKPSGLAITRNGKKWYFSWKQGEKYTEQTLQYRYLKSKWSKWKGISVKAGATSASKEIDNVKKVEFRVKGKAKGKNVSAYVKKTYTIVKPKYPALGVTLVTASSSRFTWSIDKDNTRTDHYKGYEWQSVLVADCNVDKGADISWKELSDTGSGTKAEDSWTKNETGWSSYTASYTRWFRIRSLGWQGMVSNWNYRKHVYAIPDIAKNVSATRTAISGKGFAISATWDSPNSYAKPIDAITVQYIKTLPTVDVSYPSTDLGEVKMTLSCPSTVSGWNSLADVAGNGGKRAIAFTDDTDIDTDQCLFLRVNNRHDENIREGEPILVKNGLAKLGNPSTPSAQAGGSDNLYTVSVTRNTQINNAAIAVYFRSSSKPSDIKVIGIIQPTESSTDCIIPDFPDGDSISFGVQAFIGNYVPWKATSDTDPTYFEIKNLDSGVKMESDIVWGEGVPLPPTDVALVKINDSTVQVGWKWSWRDATQAELSWADHEDAWESTDEPQTYIINNTNAGRWNIAGLGIGTWYIRVRLLRTEEDGITYGAYCPTQVIKLSSSPDTPSLVLSSGVISKTDSVTCYWAYVSTDGTAQKQGEVCEAFYEYEAIENPSGDPYEKGWYELVDEKYIRSFDRDVDPNKTYYRTTGVINYGEPIKSTNSSQHITLGEERGVYEEFGWLPGETHHLAVRVMSVSGEASEGWSAPVPVTIADEIEAHITETSLTEVTIPIDDPQDDITEKTILSLRTLPLTATATGVGVGGSITWIIERSESYHLDRPDEDEYEGFEGETVFMKVQNGGDSLEVSQDDLQGMLDDGAAYRLIAICQDAYGQSESDSVEFEVHWIHQAIMPEAVVEKDEEFTITKITPTMPSEGYAEGDVIDIYRLSVDKPELIVEGAVFGTTYVDPYPALGEFGGHRIVYRTVNGDYITEDNNIAMVDFAADEDEAYKHKLFGLVIDFNGNRLILPYNVSFSSSWSKDFTLTKYLGGSIQGDFNPAVERSDSANSVIPIEVEPENVELLRRLAVYTGLCHVRMPDGSSFTANVEVKDAREEKWTRRLSKVTLDIKACESSSRDGMTYEDWLRDQEES